MKTYLAPEQKLHAPQTFIVAGAQRPIPETPERVDRLLAAVDAVGLQAQVPAEYGLDPLAAVHTPEYLDFLQYIHQAWSALGGSDTVVPNVHPLARDGTYPTAPVGRAGYHQADTSCPIVAETWQSARRSADAAVAAAETVLAGERAAYALCRPPGHHAYTDMAGGFCYLNNAAIAAQRLRAHHERVAVLDVDLHHGNGTQGIFYTRSDVLTASVHVDPDVFYPFYWGHRDERGRDAGLGYNLNVPLPLNAGDDAFLRALDVALDRIASFAPGALVVALGLDASADDPFGGLQVSSVGFQQIGRRIGSLPQPVVLVQEGGYVSHSLSENLRCFLEGFSEGA